MKQKVFIFFGRISRSSDLSSATCELQILEVDFFIFLQKCDSDGNSLVT